MTTIYAVDEWKKHIDNCDFSEESITNRIIAEARKKKHYERYIKGVKQDD